MNTFLKSHYLERIVLNTLKVPALGFDLVGFVFVSCVEVSTSTWAVMTEYWNRSLSW